MLEKTRIVDELGQGALLLPLLVNQALAANDRAKLLFTLFQTAKNAAEHPEAAFSHPALSREGASLAGLEGTDFDEIVDSARKLDDGAYQVPSASLLLAELIRAVEDMIRPLQVAAESGTGETGDPAVFQRRLIALRAAVPELADDAVPAGYIDAMTTGARGNGDSLHILVMDLHKAINRLQATLAEERIEGASAYRITDEDRPLIAGFMAGLNRTAPLKFDHPGLGTTATRMESRLVIQNDIGTTDAHVLVVEVEGLSATLTYTDVHRERLQFFKGLFEPFDVDWQDTATRRTDGYESDNYYLALGTYAARDRGDLARYLGYLGSRIVFLIDWNRARKRLRHFVKNRDCIALLKWAADHNFGHRAFLAMGGERLIFEAVEYAARDRLHYGEPLHEVLGRGRAIDYLQFVLRTCSEGLIKGRSERLIRDAVRAELLNYLHSAYEGMLTVAERHAELLSDLANGVREGLLQAPHAEGQAFVLRTAQRAGRWEQRADRVLNEGRAMVRRANESAAFVQLLEHADDAADSLEETAYLLTLLPESARRSRLFEPLQVLAAQVVASTQEFVKCLASGSHVHRGGAHEDLDDFLEAVDRVGAYEHATDSSTRAVLAAILREAGDFRELHLFSEIARSLEESVDALTRGSLTLRDHILDDVMTA